MDKKVHFTDLLHEVIFFFRINDVIIATYRFLQKNDNNNNTSTSFYFICTACK